MPSQEELERALKENHAQMKALHDIASAGCASQPKYWNELSIEEKIERCRQQIKRMQSQMMDIMESLSDIGRTREEMASHRHIPSGEAFLPARTRQQETAYDHHRGRVRQCLSKDADPDKVYF